jgi:hypothetical protein
MQLGSRGAGVLCVRPGNTRGDRPHHPGHVRGRAGGGPASACPHQPCVLRPSHPHPGGQRRQNTHGESDIGYYCNPALTRPHQPHVLRPPHLHPGGQRRQNSHGESGVEVITVILPERALTSLTSSALCTHILGQRWQNTHGESEPETAQYSW